MKKDIELAWDSEPSEPTTYEFYYKILEGDNCGRDPTDGDYSWKSKSCLTSIANNTNKVCNWHWGPFIFLFLGGGGGGGGEWWIIQILSDRGDQCIFLGLNVISVLEFWGKKNLVSIFCLSWIKEVFWGIQSNPKFCWSVQM